MPAVGVVVAMGKVILLQEEHPRRRMHIAHMAPVQAAEMEQEEPELQTVVVVAVVAELVPAQAGQE
jgi:hypothetical protein